MGTKRVKVPQKDGQIGFLHSAAGVFVNENYPVHNGAVEVDERYVDAFLSSVAGSELVEKADEKPETDFDKTKK
jgi:hypothetical protein